MVQIRAGHKTQSITLGSMDRPANGSHFRNLKCLKIDEVVSQQQQKNNKERKKNHKRGNKGRKGKRKEGKRYETI